MALDEVIKTRRKELGTVKKIIHVLGLEMNFEVHKKV